MFGKKCRKFRSFVLGVGRNLYVCSDDAMLICMQALQVVLTGISEVPIEHIVKPLVKLNQSGVIHTTNMKCYEKV